MLSGYDASQGLRLQVKYQFSTPVILNDLFFQFNSAMAFQYGDMFFFSPHPHVLCNFLSFPLLHNTLFTEVHYIQTLVFFFPISQQESGKARSFKYRKNNLK